MWLALGRGASTLRRSRVLVSNQKIDIPNPKSTNLGPEQEVGLLSAEHIDFQCIRNTFMHPLSMSIVLIVLLSRDYHVVLTRLNL